MLTPNDFGRQEPGRMIETDGPEIYQGIGRLLAFALSPLPTEGRPSNEAGCCFPMGFGAFGGVEVRMDRASMRISPLSARIDICRRDSCRHFGLRVFF